MTIDATRLALRERVVVKRQMTGSSFVMTNINNTLQKYPELSVRERDYAFRSSIEARSIYQWASYYNIHYNSMYRIDKNPKVKLLKEEIQTDIRKFTVGMQVFLLREAMSQYVRIFRVHEDSDNLEAKRKAAKEVMSWFGMTDDPDGEDKPRALNVNIYGDKGGSLKTVSSDDETIDVSYSELEKEMHDLKMLEDMREKVRKHSDGVEKKNKLSNGGFGDGSVPEITID